MNSENKWKAKNGKRSKLIEIFKTYHELIATFAAAEPARRGWHHR